MSNSFDRRSFIDGRHNRWWQWDKYYASGSVDLTFEEFTCEATSASGIPAITSDMLCYFAAPQFQGAGLQSDKTGNLDATMAEATFGALATQDNPVESTGDVACSLIEPHIEMVSGLAMVCTFLPLAITMGEETNMADMELSFKEPDLFMTGGSTYVNLDLDLPRFDCEMHSGIPLELEMEELELEMRGSIGLVATLDARMRRMDLAAIGGRPPHIDAEFLPMQFEGVASSPITARLTGSLAEPTMEMLGSVDILASIDARFNLVACEMTGGNHPVGSISLDFIALRAALTGRQDISSDLQAELSLLTIRATAGATGPNDFVVEFPELELDMGGDGLGEAGAECDLADTLVYGE